MNQYAQIKRVVSNETAEVVVKGGVVKNRMITPKGIYSKPINDNAIVIPINGGKNQDIVLAIQQEPDDLKDGDVVVTDDVNFIYLRYSEGSIEIITDKVVFKTKEVDFGDASILSKGKHIDGDHVHTETGSVTLPPQ